MGTNLSYTLDRIILFYSKYQKIIVSLFLAFAFIVAGGVYWFITYTTKKQVAYQSLAEVLSEVKKAHKSSELWSDIAFGGKTGAQQFSNTPVAAYFFFLQAEALLQDKNEQEALQVMQKAFDVLDSKSIVYDLFLLKFARIKMAIEDPLVKKEGVALLQELATKKNSLIQDKALYYQAEYYEGEGMVAESMDVWEKLAAFKQEDLVSPWVVLAQERIRVERE